MKPLFTRAIVACLLFIATSSHAQTGSEKVKVFLDCTQSWLCDYDYVRTEMKMVDFVRDRFQSDVHVLITTQFSSSGGAQQRMNLIGQKKFMGMSDTLTYFTDPTATDDEKRKALVQYLKLGLTRYIAQTSYGQKLQIGYTQDSTGSSAKKDNAAKKDPWNYWVFQLGASGSSNGNQNSRSSSLYGYINADRETEEWKINSYVSFDKSTDVYKDTSGETKFHRKNYNGGLQIAKSINKHWSYGLASSYQNSLYSNIKAGFLVQPKLEYSLFPYSKFNTQRIVIQYFLGPQFNSYYDTTIYFKTKEWQVKQSISVITSFSSGIH